MKAKKKQLDFTVRPRASNNEMRADAREWVRAGADAEGQQKRLTLNLPADVHTSFKGRCVREGVTIQDKVRVLIERELSQATIPPPEAPAESR